ncbi:MAG: hypothetical protein H6983_26645 [Ectothiorhodospiraceae bacterium]|nr:hypothetical protein [Ectothiorhodospiraceae bacterium]
MTDRTTVTWTITDADGNPLANRMVYATLVAGVGGGSVDSLVVAERATARTDADGIATFSLWPNEAIDPDGTYYAFTADFARPPIVRYVEVPTSASPVEVADLDAVEPVTVGGFVPAPSSGDAFDVLRLRADGAAAEWAAPSGGGVSLSGDAPKALGTVAAGVGTEASRSDHVHPMPSPSDVGATPTTRTLAGLDLSADRSASALRTALSLVPGTDVQAYDADLAAIAALATTTYGRSLLTRTDSPVWAHQQIAWLQWKAYDGGGGGAPTRAQGSRLTNGVVQTTNTLGHWIEWYAPIDPGTWTLTIIHDKNASLGEFAVTLDGSSLGTVNMYAASLVANNVTEISGIPVTTPGPHVLRFTSIGTGGGGQYAMAMEAFGWMRTA